MPVVTKAAKRWPVRWVKAIEDFAEDGNIYKAVAATKWWRWLMRFVAAAGPKRLCWDERRGG